MLLYEAAEDGSGLQTCRPQIQMYVVVLRYYYALYEDGYGVSRPQIKMYYGT